ncbi:MAG: DUF4239 domain-containing protein [Acidobacteriaceae bacterium]|nr:DUF4239 domain-containing protein [Acidobacteriaceae bacterium]
MLDFFQSSLLVAGGVALSLLLLWQLRRVWPPQSRKPHNDLIGWQIGFLGTSYAVIIAFMLSGVWNDYQSAETNVEVEANSLILLYRMADGMPAAACAQLKSLTRRYANAVITEEWPAMSKGISNDSGARLIQSMWKVALGEPSQTPREEVVLNRVITELSSLAEHYRVRQLQSRSQLPGLFWLVLIAGGAITVGYTCLLGVESHRMHVIQVATTSFVISLILVTIADVDQPFRGSVHIAPDPFQMALKTFDAAP